MNKEIQKDESPNLSLNNQRNIQKDSVINTSINNINYAITNNNNNSNILIQDDYNEFHSKIEEYSPKKSKINSKNNIEKIQQLIESKRILSTLRTIKSNNSVNYEDIKLLPTLFVDMQEALKKSNANVLELKETIKDKLDSEKNLKDKIKEMELENKKILEKLYQHKTKENEMKQKFDELKYENLNLNQNLEYNSSIQKKLENLVLENKNLKRLNTELNKKIENYEEEINFLNKSKQELELKNKKFKNAQGLLQTEICNIEEYLEDVKNFQIEIKKMQHELKTIKELNKKLEDDKKKALKENYNYINTIKDMKIELKNLLNEKMELLKLEKESQNKTNILFKEIQEEKKKNEKLIKNLGEFDEIKIKYKEMLEEFNKISNENEELKEELQSKNIEDINKLKEKYETEVFELKSLINIWKNNFLEISKFNHQEIESIIDIDENYIENAPSEIKDISKKVLEYFKLLIEQENYKTVDLKHLKESLISEQEKVNILSHKLKNEKFLRRKIHNRYMYLRGNLRVMCRVRPFLPSEKINKKSQIETMVINNDSISIFQENKQEKNFEYDYIFDTKSTQKDVYEEVTLLIQSMVQGNNICIIAYGQTCTGKTYTIQGPNSKNPGIVPRAARELFLILNNFNKSNFFESIRLSMTIIEIYNEQIYNLLEESTPNLNMYEDASGNLIIPDLNPISINSFDEANKLFKLAAKFRHTSSTEYNDRSSRSHCIFSFQLKLTGKDGRIIRSTLHIIDLAGSERISKSQNKDEKLRKESICINLSLHSLSTVLNSIALKANHIPYRDSKLTHFLKDSLNENYNILLILLVSPNVKDISETISTLQFGERIVKICHHKTGKDKIQFLNSK